MVSRGKYEEVVAERDARPNITKEDWDDYRNRPTPEQVAQEVQKEKEKYSNHISPEKLTTDYVAKNKLEEEARKLGMIPKEGMVSKEDYDKVVGERDARPTQTDLDTFKKMIQDYENGLKIGLGLDNNNLSNWRDEIDRLKNRPTADSLNQMRGKLEASQNHLQEWTNKFPGQPADKVLKELNDLRAKPADTTLINEKQQKINELIEIVERQNQSIDNLGQKLQEWTGSKDYKNQIEDISRYKS